MPASAYDPISSALKNSFHGGWSMKRPFKFRRFDCESFSSFRSQKIPGHQGWVNPSKVNAGSCQLWWSCQTGEVWDGLLLFCSPWTVWRSFCSFVEFFRFLPFPQVRSQSTPSWTPSHLQIGSQEVGGVGRLRDELALPTTTTALPLQPSWTKCQSLRWSSSEETRYSRKSCLPWDFFSNPPSRLTWVTSSQQDRARGCSTWETPATSTLHFRLHNAQHARAPFKMYFLDILHF